MKKKLSVLISGAILGGSFLFLLSPTHAQQASSNAPGASPAPQYPAMHSALKYLEQAKQELATSHREFGGHKAAALKHIDEAIKEVKEGLKSAEEKH